MDNMVSEHRQPREYIDRVSPGLWGIGNTKYGVMENNTESKSDCWGGGLGMDIALYVARIIYYDITAVQASLWLWWTAPL